MRTSSRRNGRAQWPLLSLLLLLLSCADPLAFVLASTTPFSSSSSSAPSASDAEDDARVTTAVVVGATGNLATKYLWVALFRLALRASLTHSGSFAFVAGASDPPERGAQWLRGFFDDAFERRVCGASAIDDQQARVCSAFYRQQFVPSVQYMPLRSEAHYRDAARILNGRKAATTEAGRLVYLAIPPDYFLQTCELVDRFLRIPRDNPADASAAFLRVVIEKPFGTSAESARALATRLQLLLRDDEIYLMDHYAGKPGVRAWRSYLERNRGLLRPLWSSHHIRHVQIEMTETETLERRVQYFHSTGIVRDVMANHLHLLLGFTIAPSAVDNTPSEPKQQHADHGRDQRLDFTRSLHFSSELLRSWQYAEYRAHYEDDTRSRDSALAFGAVYTPTAARVTLTSDQSAWSSTLFTVAAAKAAAERLVLIQIAFSSIEGDSPCMLDVVVQRADNARGSQRMEWSCDMVSREEEHVPPEGWQFTDASKRVMVPSGHRLQEQQLPAWQLGDEVSAYDSLLWDAAVGDKSHFADIDEVLAAWNLWMPIVEAAETGSAIDFAAEDIGRRTYSSGSTPWKSGRLDARNSDARAMASTLTHMVDEL